MITTAEPLFLGNHPAIDFLNTAFAPDGEQMEVIPDGRRLLDWLTAVGLVEESEARKLTQRFGAKALDAAAAQARKMRERTRRWLFRWSAAPERNYSEDIAALNEQLRLGAWRRELIASGDEVTTAERLRLDSADAVLALIAAQIAALITSEQPDLVKQCAGAGCTLWFLDRTKAHRQRFCSAAVCGNRAKVAAFRERQRR